ncbi:MAG: HU family DNA-binding protein [Deltaproteobacteria bacterium]|jgi:DNA-binding protein HU-beta|nr:HU family DNA-binding protein [Deltaproteobacteria bacterium]
MTKAELVAKIAEKAELTQTQATKALNSLIDILGAELQATGTQTIASLGVFSVVTRSSRPGVNPRTKEPIVIPETKNVKFKAAKALKDLIND